MIVAAGGLLVVFAAFHVMLMLRGLTSGTWFFRVDGFDATRTVRN